MEKEENIKRYSANQLEALRAHGGGETDFDRVRAKSNAQLERDIADDPDFRDIPDNWYEAAKAVMPVSKKLLSLRLDAEIVEWFKQQGPGYQTRMNAVLKAFRDQTMKSGSSHNRLS